VFGIKKQNDNPTASHLSSPDQVVSLSSVLALENLKSHTFISSGWPRNLLSLGKNWHLKSDVTPSWLKI